MSVVARVVADVHLVEDEVLAGLRSHPKRLPYRTLHEAHGAELHARIAGLDDYYPARCELRLLDAHLPAIAADVGIAARVIEPASSVDIRTKRLLRALDRPAIYVGIDLARAPLERGADALQCQHSDMDVHAVVADFTHSFALPPVRRTFGKTLVFCPGSTIDTFEPHDAVAFLGGLLRIAGPNARLLLGADGTREPSALMHAYDDDDGVTAEFDLDVLSRLNSTHGAQFDPRAFEHRAVWNDTYARVELHLVSKHDQTVRVRGEDVRFRAGEPLVTEHLYKHTPHAMRGILHAAGWQVRQVFTASEQPVRLWLCEPG